MWGIWGSYYSITKAMPYLLKGDYRRGLVERSPIVGTTAVDMKMQASLNASCALGAC